MLTFDFYFRLSGNTINVQLLGEDCTIVEAKLLRAKQKHADIYAKLELTKKELARNRQGQGQVSDWENYIDIQFIVWKMLVIHLYN